MTRVNYYDANTSNPVIGIWGSIALILTSKHYGQICEESRKAH